jgi:hypothetical protein
MYQQMAGNLIYLTITRSNIAFSVGIVSRYMQEPKKVHLVVAKRVLRYIKGTLDYGILYSNHEFSLVSSMMQIGSEIRRREVQLYIVVHLEVELYHDFLKSNLLLH